MIDLVRAVFIVMLAASTASNDVVAQGDARASADQRLTGDIREEFSRDVKTSSASRSLVGLMLGTPPQRLDILGIRALVPSGLAAQQLCFSATTSDGVYSAVGALRVPRGAHGTIGVRAEGFSRFGPQLAGYAGTQFTGSFTASDDCGWTANAVLLPGTFGGDPGILHAAINSHAARRLQASLVARGGQTVAGTCVRADRHNTAFDTVCSFRFDPKQFVRGEAKLIITRTPRSGPPRADSYRLHVAG